MRNYAEETEKRIAFIRKALEAAHADGIIFGNSGGKDSALVGILCKMACEDTVGVLMPCATAQNYGSDTDDAHRLAEQFGIECRTVDLTETRNAEIAALESAGVTMNSAAAAISMLIPTRNLLRLIKAGFMYLLTLPHQSCGWSPLSERPRWPAAFCPAGPVCSKYCSGCFSPFPPRGSTLPRSPCWRDRFPQEQ